MQDFDRPGAFEDRDRHAANIALYLILSVAMLMNPVRRRIFFGLFFSSPRSEWRQ